MFHNIEDFTNTYPLYEKAFKYFKKQDLYNLYEEGKKNFAVNGTDLCVAFHNHTCLNKDIVLSVTHTDIQGRETAHGSWTSGRLSMNFSAMWSIIHQPVFQVSKCSNYSLCEKPVFHTTILTNCSAFYMSCNEGTCIHDSLVCDGYSHCPHGEDEADCQHICSDNSHNCLAHCHHRDLCSCSPGYFQCLSGGCVPLQKLCDKTEHCIDASDEPPTCVYLRPEHLNGISLAGDINNYINILVQQNKVVQYRCLQSSYGSLLRVQNVEYKMHSSQQKCSPSVGNLSPDIEFPCNMMCLLDCHEQFFSSDRLCIYDHDCDDDYNYHCFNGFHLLKCEHMYCVGRFKCLSSYCISFEHICNKVCDCPQCEDERICSKLLCPSMVPLGQIGPGLRCSMNVATLKYSMNLRQIIHRNRR